MPHDLPLQQRIQAAFDGLSPALQAAARHVLEQPQSVLMQSMRQLATSAGVPAASMQRLAQALGYSAWPDLKAAAGADLGLDTAGSYSDRASRLRVNTSQTGLLGALREAQTHNVQALFASQAASLQSVASALQTAPRVHIAGFRASHAMAYELAYVYRLFRDSVELLDGHAGGLEMQMRRFKPADAVLVFGFEPCSKESIEVAQAAVLAGCTLLALTDSAASPLARKARHSVLFGVASPSFFPSVVAGMAAVEALLELLVADADTDVVARIDASERQLSRSGAYARKV